MTCDPCLYSEKDVYLKGLSNAIGLVSIGPGIKKLIFCMGRAKTAKTREFSRIYRQKEGDLIQNEIFGRGTSRDRILTKPTAIDR